jgi:hypothetical protein
MRDFSGGVFKQQRMQAHARRRQGSDECKHNKQDQRLDEQSRARRARDIRHHQQNAEKSGQSAQNQQHRGTPSMGACIPIHFLPFGVHGACFASARHG